MKTWIKVLIVTVVLAVITLLISPNGPLGTFWAPPPDFPTPTGAQLPLFMLLGIFEAVAFGLGISFLIFGYPLIKAIAPASTTLTTAAHLAIAWLLINWWPHDSLHIFNGIALNGLLAIEYTFHVTLIVAGVVLAYFFLTILRQQESLAV